MVYNVSPGNNRRKLRDTVFGHFPPGIWLMTWIDLLVTACFSLSFPYLSLYLHDVRDIPMSIVGLIFLIGGLCAAATSMVGGILSDRFGRRALLVGASTLSIFAYAGLAMAVGFSVPIWTIAVTYFVARAILGTINPTIGAVVADLASKERITETYAFVRIGGNLGFAIAPAIGGYLLGILSYGWLLGISAVTCGLMALIILFFLRESRPDCAERVTIRNTLAVANDKSFLIFNIFCLLLFASMAQLGSTLSIFTVDRLGFSTVQYGLLLTANGIIVVLTQFPAARLMKTLPANQGLMLGSLFYAAGYLTLGWINHFDWAFTAIVLVTFGEVVFAPLSSAVVANTAADDKRGRYMGFFGLSSMLGFAIAPLFGGVLLDAFPSQPRLLWGIISLVGVTAAFGFFFWGKGLKNKPELKRSGLQN